MREVQLEAPPCRAAPKLQGQLLPLGQAAAGTSSPILLLPRKLLLATPSLYIFC